MTNEPKFVRITVSRKETKEPVFQVLKPVYPEGYKYKSLGYSKAPKIDWWKPEQLDKPQHEWD